MSGRAESGVSRWYVWPATVLLGSALFFLPTGAAWLGSAIWWAFGLTALALVLIFRGLVRDWPLRLISVRSGFCAFGAFITAGKPLAFPPPPADVSARLLGSDLPPAACYGALVPLLVFLLGAIVVALPRPATWRDEPGFDGYAMMCLLLSIGLAISVPNTGQYIRSGAQELQLSALTNQGVDPSAEHSGTVDTAAPNGPPRIAWSLPASPGATADGATIARDVVVTLHKSASEATVSGLDRGSGARQWHFTISGAHRVGGIAVDADTGQVVLSVGDTALVLDGTTGARERIVRMPPAPESAAWVPLAADGSGLATATTLSGTMMPFVAVQSGQFFNSNYAVARLDLSNNTVTDLDRPQDTGCDYRFADTTDHSWAYLVRSRCGQTTVHRYLRGETDSEMSMPDADCELGCNVQSIAQDDTSLTISSDNEVTRLDVSSGGSRIDWRDRYDQTSVLVGRFLPASNRQAIRTAVFRAGSADLLDDNDGHVTQTVPVPSPAINIVLGQRWLQFDQTARTATIVDTGTLRPLGSVPFDCDPSHVESTVDELIATCTDGRIIGLIE